jgi:hypothetical protein
MWQTEARFGGLLLFNGTHGHAALMWPLRPSSDALARRPFLLIFPVLPSDRSGPLDVHLSLRINFYERYVHF